MNTQRASPSGPSPGNFSGSTSAPLLLVSKFAIPPLRPDVVDRPRLTRQLDLGNQRPITLIAAPAGFGKTTLVRFWLEHAPVVAAWISLERGDDDFYRFWSCVFSAVDRVMPESGVAALALLQGGVAPQAPSIETVLTIWINHLAELSHDIALILDDFHLITAPPIQRSVAYLLEHLPSQLHLVITTRADPPLPLARLRSQGNLTEIRVADLRFTSEEIAIFLAQTHGIALAAKDLTGLEERTEGWIAGLHLAALSMQGHKDIPRFLDAFTGSHRYIIDYLVEEVLAQQPEAIQSFLRRTAILERLQGSLCEAVAGDALGEMSGQAMLDQLEHANLFLIPLDEERRWYRYHQLFAEALRHRLRREPGDQASELHRRASRWYEQQGLLHDAVHHALAAPDFALAARLMEQGGNTLVRQGEIATLQQWLAALPDELVRSNIEFSIWQGWLLFVTGKHAAALQHLQAMEQTFGLAAAAAEQPEHTPFSQAAIMGRMAAIRASIAIANGDLPRTITLARQALTYLPPESMARSYVAGYLGKAHYFVGDFAAARLALEEACRISQEVHHSYGLFLVIADLAHLHMLQGRLNQADQVCLQALQQAEEQDGTQPARGPALVVRGQIAREWNKLDVATNLLQEGIKLCEQTANSRAQVQAHIALALIQQARGDSVGANALMRQATQRTERQRLAPPRGTQEAAAFQAWLHLMQGDEAAASRWVAQSGIPADQNIDPLREREYLTLARILIAQQKFADAAQWIAKLLPCAEAQGRTGSVIELHMLEAEILQASGAVEQAVERLADALNQAEPEGYLRLFVDEGPALARLLQTMRQRRPDVQPHYRERLLALLSVAPDRESNNPTAGLPETNLQPPNEPLSARELAILRLIVAGSSNQEIADQLVLALSTVKWYINAIYGKLQVASRTKAIARARELHIV